MSHRQILVPKLTSFSNFWWCGSKKLIFNGNEGLLIRNSLSKNGNQNRPLPEVTVVWSDRKWENFWTENRKFFDILSLDGGRGLWSLISDNDVITGNGPNQKNFHGFLGFRSYWIQFLNLFYKVYLPSLRSASVPTLVWRDVRLSKRPRKSSKVETQIIESALP